VVANRAVLPLLSWDMAVVSAIVIPLVTIPIYLGWPWWSKWLAPVVFVGLVFVWSWLRFRIAGVDPNTGDEKNRGAQI
jgi:hypothetical protein